MPWPTPVSEAIQGVRRHDPDEFLESGADEGGILRRGPIAERAGVVPRQIGDMSSDSAGSSGSRRAVTSDPK